MEKRKILIVDDEQTLVVFMQTRLSSQGYDVITANSGPEALDLLTHERPDLILLDILMPKMDGIEVCRQIKSQPDLQHIPVIFLTAKDQIVDRIEGMKCGAEDYITKPYDPPELLFKIERQLKSAEQ